MKNLLTAILFVAGFILAGADGNWFPWLNMVGIFCFSCVYFLTLTRDVEGEDL